MGVDVAHSCEYWSQYCSSVFGALSREYDPESLQPDSMPNMIAMISKRPISAMPAEARALARDAGS